MFSAFGEIETKLGGAHGGTFYMGGIYSSGITEGWLKHSVPDTKAPTKIPSTTPSEVPTPRYVEKWRIPASLEIVKYLESVSPRSQSIDMSVLNMIMNRCIPMMRVIRESAYLTMVCALMFVISLRKKLAQNLRTLLMTKRPANTQRSSIPARDAYLSPYVHCNAKYMTEIRNVGIHFRSSSNMMDAFIKLKQRNEKRFNLQRAYYNLIKVYTLNDVVFVLSIVYCLGITSLNSNGAMKIHKITERQIISKPLCIY